MSSVLAPESRFGITLLSFCLPAHIPMTHNHGSPKSMNKSQTQISNLMARMLPPFGPAPPEHVSRSAMVAAGFPVDKFCGSVKHIDQRFIKLPTGISCS